MVVDDQLLGASGAVHRTTSLTPFPSILKVSQVTPESRATLQCHATEQGQYEQCHEQCGLTQCECRVVQ